MRNTNNKDEVFGEDGVHSLYFHINIIYYSIQLKGMNNTYMRAIQKEFSIYDHLFVIINTHITLCTTCGHLFFESTDNNTSILRTDTNHLIRDVD